MQMFQLLIVVLFASCNPSIDSSITTFRVNNMSKFETLEDDSVHFLSDIDSALEKEVKKSIKVPTNILTVFKSESVSVYQIGCVNSANFISCNHKSGSYIFFIKEGKMHLIGNNTDLNLNVNEITLLFDNDLKTPKEKKEIIIEQVKQIVNDNILNKKNKKEKPF